MISSNSPNYHQAEGNIPIDLKDGDFDSLTRQNPLKIYNLGFQPAKSIPEIPRWFLQKYANKPFTMLEPFAGLGTTIIESLIYGAFVYWLDYNPLSHLICRVRTSEISSQTARQEAEKYTWRHPVGHLSQFKRAWDYASSLDTP